jgi:hypothetical protein
MGTPQSGSNRLYTTIIMRLDFGWLPHAMIYVILKKRTAQGNRNNLSLEIGITYVSNIFFYNLKSTKELTLSIVRFSV